MRQSKGFEFLEHTADLRFRSYGESLEECFSNAAKALSSSMVDLKDIEAKKTEEIAIESMNLEDLLHDFLTEILFLFETEGLIFSEFDIEIEQEEGYLLKGVVGGEEYDPKKHLIKTEIKAVTYHELMIEKKNGAWTAEVLCDV